MCDVCSGIYHSDAKHNITACPVRAAMFCSCCQVYGHSTMRCPDRASWETRAPEFLEQLIPPNVRAHHNITSMTPLNHPNVSPYHCDYSPVLEVPEDKDGKFIRATLTSHNIPVSGIKENKRVLEAFSALIGKKVVYIQNEVSVAEKQAKKDKKVFKVKKAN